MEANNCPTYDEIPMSRYETGFSHKETCKHNFELIFDDGEVKMKRSYNETLLGPHEYCLLQYNGTSMFDRIAKICRKDEVEVKTKQL